MKKTLTLLTSLILITVTALSQNYDWAHGYKNSFSFSTIKVLNSPDNNGGVFVAMNLLDSINPDPQQPTAFDVPAGGAGVLISRIDAGGNLLFSHMVEMSHYEYYQVHDLQTLSDGSFYVIATSRIATYPFDVDPSAAVTNISNRGLIISHFDANGNLLNVKELDIETFKFEFFESAISANDELLISGAVYYMAHFSTVTGQDSTYANNVRRVFTAQYDSNLDLDWVDYFENDRPTQYTRFNYGSTVVKPNGNTVVAYAFGGTITLANTNTYTASGEFDVVLLEYDPTGTLLRDYVLSTAGNDDYIEAIAIDANSNIAILGYMRNTVDIDLAGTYTGASDVQSSYFALYDENFNLRHFKSGTMGNSRPRDCQFASNGDLVVGGRLFGTFDFDFQTGGQQFYSLSSPAGNNYDVFLAKYDTALNVVYAKNIGNSSNYGDLRHLKINSSDDIFISGELGGGLTDMNFGPDTNEVDGISSPFGFIGRYTWCSTVQATATDFACMGETYTFPDGFTQTITGPVTRQVRIPAVSSCDSVLTLTVDVAPEYTVSDTVSVCNGESYTYPDGTVDSNIVSTTSHVSTVPTVFGCDSVITTVVNVTPVFSVTDTVEVCSGSSYTFPDGSTQDSITGPLTYTSTLSSSLGCDSLVHTSVSVITEITAYESVSVCHGGSYTFADGVTEDSIVGQVVHVSMLQSAGGCDSILTTTVNVTAVDTSITQSGNTLTVGQNGATYQWYDCNTSSVISGETNASFEIASAGSYQVEVNVDGCSATSSCVDVVPSSISTHTERLIRCYPNPFSETITVEAESTMEAVHLFSATGEEMRIAYLPQAQRFQLDLGHLSSGIYVLKVMSEGQLYSYTLRKR